MQSTRVLEKPPVGVVLDCDMAGIDDALTLGLLFGLDGKRECRFASISLSRPNLKAAAFCDSVSRFYAGPAAPFMRMLPVGMELKGEIPGAQPLFEAPLAKPEHKTTIESVKDTADPSAVIRNAFTAHHDGNCLVVLAGPAVNLLRVMALPGVPELIKAKIRRLVIAPDPSDLQDTNKLLSAWPGPIDILSQEIGEQILYPASSIETGFSWSPAHPIVDAYKAYKTMPYDASTLPLAALLQAVRPQESYFKASDPGSVTMLEGGQLKLTPSADGKHRQLVYDPAQRDRIVKTYTELVSAKPVPRMPRFRPMQQEEEKKQDDKKPDTAKPKAEQKT